MLGMFGLRVISDAKMVEDSGERSWARVRSHSRARRRLKRGYRQNIDIIWVPKKEFLRFGDTIVGHPAMIQKLKEATQPQSNGD